MSKSVMVISSFFKKMVLGSLMLMLLSGGAVWASSASSQVSGLNTVAIATFLAFVVVTIIITGWAAKKVKSRQDFLVAGGGLTPWQNGMAIAGDFMSAATFLGITGALYFRGMDASILAVGIMIGWPIILMVIAERFRNLGKFTFIDVLANRLDARPIRIMASCVSLTIVLFYLIAQMVGAGTLIQILFGLDYAYAVVAVGVLMIFYVAFGGMVATTWVQIIKATLLLFGGTFLAFMIMKQVGFSVSKLIDQSTAVSDLGEKLALPGSWYGGDPFYVASIALTMTFGIMGLPHILMRFFTVKDAASARQSVFYATSVMGYFYLLIMIIGLGAAIIIAGDGSLLDSAGRMIGGANMVAVHLSRAVGGDIMYGFMAAVSFATILAVVAGLTISGAATISHDLYAQVFKKDHAAEGAEVGVTKKATIVIGLFAVLLGFAFEGQNVAVTAAIALAVAASVNFPIIFLVLYWKNLTTAGVVGAGYLGLIICCVLIILSPGVWVDVLGYKTPIFPYTYPTVVAMPVTFLVAIIVSLCDRSDRAGREKESFMDQAIESELGLHVDGPSGH